MIQETINDSTTLPFSRVHIDSTLRKKIDAAVGGPTHLDSAVLIDGGSPQPKIVVVVVERCHLPTDDELQRIFNLTPREIEVARLLAERLSDEEIAHRLNVKLNTARCHSCRVLGKLGVHARNDVRGALESGDATSQRPPARHVA